MGEPGELAEHSVWKLIESFADLLRKAGSKISHDVVGDRVSVGERINQIVDRLERGGGSFRFDSLVDLSLSEADLRHQLVVTLLAILELAKLQVIRVLQDPASEVFFIAQREGASLESVLRADLTSDQESRKTVSKTASKTARRRAWTRPEPRVTMSEADEGADDKPQASESSEAAQSHSGDDGAEVIEILRSPPDGARRRRRRSGAWKKQRPRTWSAGSRSISWKASWRACCSPRTNRSVCTTWPG